MPNGVQSAGSAGKVITMMTSGGPHPAEHWGRVSAARVVELLVLEKTAPDSARIARDAFAAALVPVLTEQHQRLQDLERKMLDDHGAAHLDVVPNLEALGNAAARWVTDVASQTPFAAHFAKPAVVDYLVRMFGQHFGTSIHIERSWFTDRHPTDPQCIAYRKKFTQDVA